LRARAQSKGSCCLAQARAYVRARARQHACARASEAPTAEVEHGQHRVHFVHVALGVPCEVSEVISIDQHTLVAHNVGNRAQA